MEMKRMPDSGSYFDDVALLVNVIILFTEHP
jgi:hypothetical protein